MLASSGMSAVRCALPREWYTVNSPNPSWLNAAKLFQKTRLTQVMS